VFKRPDPRCCSWCFSILCWDWRGTFISGSQHFGRASTPRAEYIRICWVLGDILYCSPRTTSVLDYLNETIIDSKFPFFSTRSFSQLMVDCWFGAVGGLGFENPQKWIKGTFFWGGTKMIPNHRAPNQPRWWFQIFFMFIPTWGRFPFWRAYFSKGLVQPPTSNN